MRTEPARFAGLALALALLAHAPDSRAFCRTTTVPPSGAGPGVCPDRGHPLYWKSSCVGYHMNEAASAQLGLADAESSARQAFDAWLSPGAVCSPSISIVELAPTSSAEVGYDLHGSNENLIVFHDDNGDFDPLLLELPTVTFNAATGEIYDVDIELNSHDHQLNQASWTYVLTHSAGHFLGLAHSPDPNAVMFASFKTIESASTPHLANDDAAGICAIYPETGERVTTDDSGAELRVAASPCDLSPTGAPATCGSPIVDHGCSLSGVGAAGTGGAAGCVILAAAGICARRRRFRGR